MNTLHLLNESPFASQSLAEALLFIALEDGLLLMGDAVYALTSPALQLQLDNSLAYIYALEEDINARAISNIDSVNIINYESFVMLCTQYKKVVSW